MLLSALCRCHAEQGEIVSLGEVCSGPRIAAWRRIPDDKRQRIQSQNYGKRASQINILK